LSLTIFLKALVLIGAHGGGGIPDQKQRKNEPKETSQEAEVQKDFGRALSRKKLHRRLEKIYPEGQGQHAS
jgi:hypothetical protein